MIRGFAELSESGSRIELRFPYDPSMVGAVKAIPGARFVPRDKGGPLWSLPRRLDIVMRLMETFGDGLDQGEALRRWNKAEASAQRNLRGIALASHAELELLPKRLPLLGRIVDPPPDADGKGYGFQTADISFMAQRSCINANQPGMGKTREVIGAAAEAGLLDGRHLVICPKTSIESVWMSELEAFQPHAVLAAESLVARMALLEESIRLTEAGMPHWLVINPGLIREGADEDGPVVKKATRSPEAQALVDRALAGEWTTITVDEFQDMGLGDPKSQFASSLYKLKARRRWALSGTPMGGKPLRLWGALHFVDPGAFSSRWQWATTWLKTEPNRYATSGLKIINELRPEREAEFYRAHAPWLIRRLRVEHLPVEAPVHVDVLCSMTNTQAALYFAMEENAQVKLGDTMLTAPGVLAEFTRLKQFATCAWTGENGDLRAMPDSGKIPQLLSRLHERADEKALVGTQFKAVAEMLAGALRREGWSVALMTGDTKDRAEIVRAFQEADDPQVLVMTTKTGGVSLNLNRADSVHIIDETWDPDNQEQLWSRPDRGARTKPVTVYRYMSRDSIEQAIRNLTDYKTSVNQLALDLRRLAAKAQLSASAS